MSDEFPIIVVDSQERDESSGSKRKFWWRDANGALWLFKFNRANSGEDWAEKIAAELATLLSIPHARYEMAQFEGEPGSISLDLTNELRRGRLVLGNQLLMEIDPSYPYAAASYYRQANHTVTKVMDALGQEFIGLPTEVVENESVVDAPGLFAGYLLLDAYIGNTDRHHENWAIIDQGGAQVRSAELSPTYDHASSLGFNLRDEERTERLTTRDAGFNVQKFASRARSALYRDSEDRKPLSLVNAFIEASRISPIASKYWIDRLNGIDENQVRDVVGRIPSLRMSGPARHFALALLAVNRTNLLSAWENVHG